MLQDIAPELVGKFISTVESGDTSGRFGGAIWNNGTIGDIKGNFIQNPFVDRIHNHSIIELDEEG